VFLVLHEANFIFGQTFLVKVCNNKVNIDL